MKRTFHFALCSLFCFSACERAVEMPENEKTENETPEVEVVTKFTELYCSEASEARVSEKIMEDSLDHDALMEIVEGQVHKLVGIYNCFERNDSLFYVVQPRDGIESNLNGLAHLFGEPTRYLSIAKDYTTEWQAPTFYDPVAYYRSYSYDAETQTFCDFVHAGYTIKKFKVQYVDKECMVLFADAVYDAEEEYNSSAQFSRIVYEVVDESEVPDCDIIDLRD